MITRVFLDHSLSPGEAFELDGDQRHHLGRVLRAGVGGVFSVVDGRGRVFRAELVADGGAVVIGESSSGEERGGLVLYQAVPKGRRMEVVVEKATELGVTGIVPLITARSVVKPGEGNKLERWRRIAESAARQSLREVVPEVLAPVGFDEAVREGPVALLQLEVAEPVEVAVEAMVGVSGEPVGLFVGPEGGWSEEELSLAGESGARFAGMGPFRLRSETAGIAAVARARAVLERREIESYQKIKER